MRQLKWILILTIMFCWLKPASAQHEKGSGTIGIFNSASKLIGGNRDDGAIDPWMGLHIGYSLSPRFSFELNGSLGWSRPRDVEASGLSQWYKLKPGTPFKTFLYPVILNLKFNLNPYSIISPYAIVGGGFLLWELRDVSTENRFIPLPPSGVAVSGSQTNALYNLGVGFEIFLSDKLGLDVSGRYQRLINQDKDMSGYNDIQSGNIEARVGLNFYFGGWTDSDGDGIEDKLDLCPKEAEDFDGFEDEDGCPDLDNDGDGIPDSIDKAPNLAEDFDGFEDTDGIPDLDNDGDGIPDDKDKAPNQPEDFDGFQDEDGIPDLDNDGDGIPDDKDQCPNEPETFNGFEDEDGCPDKKPEVIIEEKAPLVLEGVTFKTNSSELTENAIKLLGPVFRTLVAYPELLVEVRGHTDNTGDALYNSKLSKQRADSVMNYLISNGIDSRRIRSIGFGEEQPIAPNETKEGRAKNRRIEFIRIR